MTLSRNLLSDFSENCCMSMLRVAQQHTKHQTSVDSHTDERSEFQCV